MEHGEDTVAPTTEACRSLGWEGVALTMTIHVSVAPIGQTCRGNSLGDVEDVGALVSVTAVAPMDWMAESLSSACESVVKMLDTVSDLVRVT
jgi:hypothetical protein